MILYKLQYIWNGDKHKNLTWVAKGLQQLLANLSTVRIFWVFYVLDLKTNPLGLHDSECFLPFIFITGAENRALPKGASLPPTPGIPAHMDGGLREAFNVVLSLFMTLFLFFR